MKNYWVNIKRTEIVEYGFCVSAENEAEAKVKGIEEGKVITTELDYEPNVIETPEIISIHEIKPERNGKEIS